MPELETVHAVWAVVDGRLDAGGLGGSLLVRLELALVQLDAVVEQELVGGASTGLDAVFDDGAGSWRTRQFLDLEFRHTVRTARSTVLSFIYLLWPQIAHNAHNIHRT